MTQTWTSIKLMTLVCAIALTCVLEAKAQQAPSGTPPAHSAPNAG